MKGAEDSERDPLAALVAGDSGPFEAYVEAETPRFIAFFLRLGAARPEAEDLTQELFLKLFRSAADYRARERFSAYAFRVARNAWIDQKRRNAARPSRGLQDPAGEELAQSLPGEAPEPGAAVILQEQIERLHRALAALPEHHRLVFELGVLQELPYAEISSLLEVPVGTVKSRMFHAVRKLRAALQEGTEEDTEGKQEGKQRK